MKRFRFRLQTVLDQRRAVEEQRQQAFAREAQARARLLARAAELEAESLEERGEMARQLAGPLDLPRILRSLKFLGGQAQRLRRTAAAQREIEVKLEPLREDLVQAMRARRVLELLEERQRRAYYQEASRQEQKLLDEVALRPFQAGPGGMELSA